MTNERPIITTLEKARRRGPNAYIDRGSQAKPPEYTHVMEIDLKDEPTIDWYINEAIASLHLSSELKLAKILGVSRATVSHWRQKKAWPSESAMLRLANIAGVDQDEALLHLSIWRTKSPAVRSIWAHMLSGIYALKEPAVVLAVVLASFGVFGINQVFAAGTANEHPANLSGDTRYYGKSEMWTTERRVTY